MRLLLAAFEEDLSTAWVAKADEVLLKDLAKFVVVAEAVVVGLLSTTFAF